MAFGELYMDCVFPGEFPQGNCPDRRLTVPCLGGELLTSLTESDYNLTAPAVISYIIPELLSMNGIAGISGISIIMSLPKRRDWF